MHSQLLQRTVWSGFALTTGVWGEQPSPCIGLMTLKSLAVEISKATPIPAGSTEPIPSSQTRTPPLPAYCRVEGVINCRTGVGGEELRINFAPALPDNWNGDFLMQG
jgi:hypothetical protein